MDRAHRSFFLFYFPFSIFWFFGCGRQTKPRDQNGHESCGNETSPLFFALALGY